MASSACVPLLAIAAACFCPSASMSAIAVLTMFSAFAAASSALVAASPACVALELASLALLAAFVSDVAALFAFVREASALFFAEFALPKALASLCAAASALALAFSAASDTASTFTVIESTYSFAVSALPAAALALVSALCAASLAVRAFVCTCAAILSNSDISSGVISCAALIAGRTRASKMRLFQIYVLSSFCCVPTSCSFASPSTTSPASIFQISVSSNRQ